MVMHSLLLVVNKKKTDEVSPSSCSKRDVHENEVDKVFHELHSKHADDYTGPQYRIWSRMIVNKIHESLEEPPTCNIPIIADGVPRGKRKRTSSSDAISEALIGAATAVTKYLATDYSGNQTPSPSTPIRRSSTTVVGISPMSKAKLSDQYITQLQRLQGLLENNVLTPEEFA